MKSPNPESELEQENYVKECFLNVTKRTAKKKDIRYFVTKLNDGVVKLNDLEKFMKKTLSEVEFIPFNISQNSNTTEEWMKKSWNERAKHGSKSIAWFFQGIDEDSYWKGGVRLRDKIIEKNDKKIFNLITQNKNPKEMRVLEIGSGLGRILIPMAQVFGEVVGVDISEEMVNIAQKKAEGVQNLKLIVNNGSDLSMFDDNYFDFCYSHVVFQHIPDKKIVENYIKEANRVLKKNGIFKFQVFGTEEKTLNETDSTMIGVRFTRDEIHQIAQKNKFEIISEENPGEHQNLITLKVTKAS